MRDMREGEGPEEKKVVRVVARDYSPSCVCEQPQHACVTSSKAGTVSGSHELEITSAQQ